MMPEGTNPSPTEDIPDEEVGEMPLVAEKVPLSLFRERSVPFGPYVETESILTIDL